MPEFSFNRRRLIKIAGGSIGAAALAPWGRTRAAPSEIVFATYETNGKPGFFDPFTKASGITVKLSYLQNEDALFASLKAGSASDWDLVNGGINDAQRFIKAKLYEPLDLAKVPNSSAMYDVFKTSSDVRGPDGTVYAVPYLWGLNPIVYRTDVIKEVPSYATLFDPKYRGALAMRDYALESVAIGGLYVGIPRDRLFAMTDSDLAEVRKALIAQKPLLRTYWLSIGDLTNQFATGEVACAFCWRVPYDQLKAKLPIAMAKPQAGIFGWCDVLAMPAGLPDDHKEASYKLINYLLGPDYARMTADANQYATSTSVIRDQLTPGKQAQIFIDDLSIMKSFMWPVAPPNYSAWVKLWNEVKAS